MVFCEILFDANDALEGERGGDYIPLWESKCVYAADIDWLRLAPIVDGAEIWGNSLAFMSVILCCPQANIEVVIWGSSLLRRITDVSCIIGVRFQNRQTDICIPMRGPRNASRA